MILDGGVVIICSTRCNKSETRGEEKKQIINSCQAIRCPTFHDETIIFIKCYQRFPFFLFCLFDIGQVMGAGDPSAADRRQAEVAPGGRLRRPCCPQAHRVRDDPLRDDDGRYSMPTISTPTRYGGRCYSTESQERRPRRHSRVHSLPASSSQGIDQLTIWSGHFFFF